MTTLFHGRGGGADYAPGAPLGREALPASSPWAPRVLSVVRVLAALIYISAGTTKLFGWPPPPPPMHGTVALVSQLGLAAVLETFGGLLLLLGLFTRPVAFVLAIEMAWAYFQVHFPRGPFPMSNMGAPALLFCLLWLYLAFAGAGPWSLDAWIQGGRKR